MLQFNQLVEQIDKMSAMIDALDFDLTDKLALAVDRFENATDLGDVQERIAAVRQSDISGYRGAAPMDDPYSQPINLTFPPPQEVLPEISIVAADGSQIYPDEQAPVHYYLLNIGLFIYHHGTTHTPQQITVPKLVFHKDHVHDGAQRLVTNRTVDARRTVQEMALLAQYAWGFRRENPDRQIVALYDNHLLFWANSDVTGSDQIMRDYESALTQLQDAGALLGGYLDNPHRSRVFTRLLYLMSLKDFDDIKRHEADLPRGGDLDGLKDVQFFNHILEPGERSAVMVQNSPRNLKYKQRGESYEIAFFYVKVFNGFNTAIARVDMPMWTARDPEYVSMVHALMLDQCQMQGITPYPYALTRADELAVVSGRDKRKLEEMINLELRRRGIEPKRQSAKDQSKRAARSDQRRYDMDTSLAAPYYRNGGQREE